MLTAHRLSPPEFVASLDAEASPVSAADRMLQVLQPHVMLPEQFLAPCRFLTGERRLMYAVLADAVCCFQKHYMSRRTRARRLFRETETWLFARDRSWPFAFERICEALDIPPENVRRGLRRWQRRQLEFATMSLTRQVRATPRLASN